MKEKVRIKPEAFKIQSFVTTLHQDDPRNIKGGGFCNSCDPESIPVWLCTGGGMCTHPLVC